MSNPISFRDFFNFEDRSAIESAKQDMRDLKTVYLDFVGAVVGGQMSLLAKQEAEVSEATKGLLESTRELSVANKDSQKQLIANSEALEKLRVQLETVRESKKSSAKQEEILGNSVDALTQRLRLQIAEFNKLDPSIDDNADRLLALGKATQQTREAIKQLTDQTKTTTAVFTAAKGSYLELDLQTKQLKKDLLEMADGFNPANAGATALKKQIFENTELLKRFDAQININNRNVGNYASGFNGLNNATSQIFRELPSAAVSLNTFFLAISNNLPILFDELKRAGIQIRETNAALLAGAVAAKEQAAAQALAAGATKEAAVAAGALAEAQALAAANGAKSTSVAGLFLKSVFSMNTLLTVGVTLLTLFGGKIVSAFTGSSEASKKAAEDAKKYKEALQDIERTSRATAETEVARLKSLAAAAANQTLRMEDRIAAIDEIKKRNPEYFAALEREAFLNGKAAAAIRDASNAIFAKASSEANYKKFSEASKVLSDVQDQAEEALKSMDDAFKKADAFTQKVISANNRSREGGALPGDANVLANRNFAQDKPQIDYEKFRKQYYDLQTQIQASQNEQQKYIRKVQEADTQVAKLNDKLLGSGRTPARIEKELAEVKRQIDNVIPGTERANALLKEQRKLEDELNTARGKRTQTDRDAAKAETAREKAERERLAAIRKHDDLIKASAKLEIAEAELVFSRSQQYVVDEIALEQAKLDAITKSTDARKALYAKDSKEYVAIVAEKAVAEGNFIANRNKAYEDMVAKDKEINDKLLQQAKDTIKASGEAYAAEDERAFSNQVNEVALRVAGRKLTPQQGEDAVHKLRQQRLQEEIDNQQAIVDNAQIQDAAYYNAKKILSDKLKALDDENAAYAIQKEQEVQQAKAALMQAAYELAGTISAGLYDNEAARLDQELSDLRLKYDTDIKLAGENKDAKDRIDEEYTAASNELKRQQAELQREQTIFNIGLTTAEKIIQAYPNPFLMAAAAAAGAIQIGLVASRPVPSYYTGREDGPAEIAEVNERGTELIRSRRTGKYRIAAGGERGLAMLDKGDQVLTHDKSVKLAKERFLNFGDTDDFVDSLNEGNRIARSSEEAARYGLAAAMAGGMNKETLTSAFKDAVADLPVEENHFDDNGHRRFTRRRNTRVQILNERNRMGGNH